MDPRKTQNCAGSLRIYKKDQQQRLTVVGGRQPTYYSVKRLNSWEIVRHVLNGKPPDIGERPKSFNHASLRLRYILHQLNNGELPPDDLKKNLEYAACVLESAYIDESRRFVDEVDDDLSEVSPDSVPVEVRDWLTSTFTRPQKIQPLRRFKSVANALRMGIKFEKMFRRTSSGSTPQCSIPANVQEALVNVDKWDFDIFKLNEVSELHALKYIGFYLFNRYRFMTRFRIPVTVVEAFLNQMEVGYTKHNNPYHNLIHGADVAQTVHYMLSQTGYSESLSELDIFATIFSAIIHDYEHTGHTNNFHIQSGSQYAILYNDRSVLENHHISASFKLCQAAETSLLAGLTRDEFREFRNTVVDIVLSTDMSTHFMQVKTIKNMLSLPETIDKSKSLCLLVHCCDISHPSKPWHLHRRWTAAVLEEFFRQGDLEKSMGLPYSPLCDRSSVHVSDSQIGFIDFIVEPSMIICGEMLTKTLEPLAGVPNGIAEADHEAVKSENSDASSRSSTSVDVPNNSSSSTRKGSKIPLAPDGHVDIPQPWIPFMHANKARWKDEAAVAGTEL